jgi:hypothetical protein
LYTEGTCGSNVSLTCFAANKRRLDFILGHLELRANLVAGRPVTKAGAPTFLLFQRQRTCKHDVIVEPPWGVVPIEGSDFGHLDVVLLASI